MVQIIHLEYIIPIKEVICYYKFRNGLIIMDKPPFTISNFMLSKTISITEKLGKIETYNSLKRMPILRRNNRIKSITSRKSGNSISKEQICKAYSL